MLEWPFQAIKRAKLHITGTTSCVKFVFLLEKAKWLKRGLLLRPFADALDGVPQQTSCVESVVSLLSFTMGSATESLHCQGHWRNGSDAY